MVTVRLEGVHVVRARLRSGLTEYHYAWRGGPRLKGQPGTQEYAASYFAAHQERKQPKTGTLREILIRFKASPQFAKLGEHTERAYRRYLDMIEAEFGDLDFEALDDKAVRLEFAEWRDGMSSAPRSADYALGTLKRVLGWARERALISENHAEPIGRLHSADRSDSLWSDADFASFAVEASQELGWAIQLAGHVGLRQSDLIRLTWSAFDGRSFVLKTSKRRRDVLIPATAACRRLIGEIPKRGPIILTTERGHRPWTADGLRASFRKACQRAKVRRTFHDLRRNAATQLLIAGIDTPKVAFIMGWSEADVEALKRKYVSRQAIAEAVLAQLDREG